MRSGFRGTSVRHYYYTKIEINISAGLIPANYKSPHKEQVRIYPDAGQIPLYWKYWTRIRSDAGCRRILYSTSSTLQRDTQRCNSVSQGGSKTLNDKNMESWSNIKLKLSGVTVGELVSWSSQVRRFCFKAMFIILDMTWVPQAYPW